jgi:hypothetical protein
MHGHIVWVCEAAVTAAFCASTTGVGHDGIGGTVDARLLRKYRLACLGRQLPAFDWSLGAGLGFL